MEVLLSEINQQLSEQGLYIKMGEVSIVDASVIEANRSRPNKGKGAVLLKILKRIGTSKTAQMESVKVPMALKPICVWMKMASLKQRITVKAARTIRITL